MDIKDMRLQTGMTQKEFGEYFNIPVRTIENWETGKRNPPEYVAELIKYKYEKEGLGMLNLGEYKLKDVEESEMFYVTTLDTNIIVTLDPQELEPYKTVGKIKVYHDGLYFGSPEEMYAWIREEIIDHLIEKGNLVEDGETVLGEKFWKLKA